MQESNSLSGGEETSIYDSNSLQSGDSYDSGLAKSHRRMGSNVSTGKLSWVFSSNIELVNFILFPNYLKIYIQT